MATTLDQIHLWLTDPEGTNLEFKEARNNYDLRKVLAYCVALANEGGGKFILGVSDQRPRTIVGTSAFSEPGSGAGHPQDRRDPGRALAPWPDQPGLQPGGVSQVTPVNHALKDSQRTPIGGRLRAERFATSSSQVANNQQTGCKPGLHPRGLQSRAQGEVS